MSGLTSVAQTNSVDFIFVVDESGSMGGEHDFLQDQIPSLEMGLSEANITNNRYGLVGYGDSNVVPRSIRVGSGDGMFGTDSDFVAAANTLRLSGSTEDGYAGIIYALDNYEFRSGVLPVLVLVTDEDRDIINGYRDADLLARDPSFTDATSFVSDYLDSQDAIWVSILDQSIRNSDGASGQLLINSADQVYEAQPGGTFIRTDNGSIGTSTLERDYGTPSLQNGGVVADLNQLRSGGDSADSFTAAFLDSLVETVQVGVGTNLITEAEDNLSDSVDRILGSRDEDTSDLRNQIREYAQAVSGFRLDVVDYITRGRRLLTPGRISIGGMYTYTAVLNSRFDALHRKAIAIEKAGGFTDGVSRSGAFFEGLSSQSDFEESADAIAGKSRNWGALSGYDYAVSPNLFIGAAFGYKDTELNSDDGSDLDGDTVVGMLYGSWMPQEGVHIDGFASWGVSEFDSNRFIGVGFATTDIDQDIATVGIRGTKTFATESGVQYGPIAQLQWAYADTDGFTETGPFPALEIGDFDQSSLRTFLGGYVARPIQMEGVQLIPQLSVEWIHEYLDTAPEAAIRPADPNFAMDPYTIVEGEEAPEDTIRITFGASAVFDRGYSVYANFTKTLIQEDQDDYAIRVGFSYEY